MNDATIQLIVEIGTNRYALPKMSRELTGEDIRALVHYITQREVSLFYVKGIDQIVENHLTIYEMDLRNGDVLVAANDEQFIFQKQRASFVEKPQFDEPNHSSKKENDFDPIELVVEPGDELVDNYHIHNNNNQQHGNRNYSLFKNSEVQKTEEEARQIVNLFHIISIICCIISLLVWFTELIPCAMIYFLFASIQVKHNLLSATLLVVDIIITAIVFSLFLALIIAGAVFSFGATLFFLLLLVPYVIVLSACCASLTCCRC